MNKEAIIAMAREAGLYTKCEVHSAVPFEQLLERFAHLVAAAENRACAQIADASEPYKAMDLIMSRWKA